MFCFFLVLLFHFTFCFKSMITIFRLSLEQKMDYVWRKSYYYCHHSYCCLKIYLFVAQRKAVRKLNDMEKWTANEFQQKVKCENEWLNGTSLHEKLHYKETKWKENCKVILTWNLSFPTLNHNTLFCKMRLIAQLKLELENACN